MRRRSSSENVIQNPGVHPYLDPRLRSASMPLGFATIPLFVSESMSMVFATEVELQSKDKSEVNEADNQNGAVLVV